MFKIFNEIKNSVRKLDKFANENKCMTNPFYKPTNKTLVWTEKPFVLKIK